jgi:threonine/homoserine/homoserine lactone efflux protein
MIDTILMLLGACILGYSFYKSVKILSELKDRKTPSAWRLSMKFAAVLVLIIFFVVTLVFFGSLYSPLAENLSREFLGSFFFSGAVIVILTVKVNSMVLRNAQRVSSAYRKMYEVTAKSKKVMEKKIRGLEGELEDAKKITKHVVDRELRMIELKEEIRSLKEQLEKKRQ